MFLKKGEERTLPVKSPAPRIILNDLCISLILKKNLHFSVCIRTCNTDNNIIKNFIIINKHTFILYTFLDNFIYMFRFFTLQRDLKKSLTVLALLFIWNYLDWTRTLCFETFCWSSDRFEIFSKINLLYQKIRKKGRSKRAKLWKENDHYDSNTLSA